MTWLAALRDHPERPPVAQRMVLVSLAQRMDWSTGCGFASTAQLADDADCGERTVRSATGWARKTAMLVQTRRGHRITAERVIASEWRLRLPDEAEEPTGSGMPIGAEPTGKWDRPNRQTGWTQPASTAPPSRPSSSRTRSSANGDAANAARPPSANPGKPSWPPVEPCEYCGDHYVTWDMWNGFSEREQQEHTAGMYMCPKPACKDADWIGYHKLDSIQQLIEDGAVAEAIKFGIRQPSEFPDWAIPDGES